MNYAALLYFLHLQATFIHPREGGVVTVTSPAASWNGGGCVAARRWRVGRRPERCNAAGEPAPRRAAKRPAARTPRPVPEHGLSTGRQPAVRFFENNAGFGFYLCLDASLRGWCPLPEEELEDCFRGD